MARRIVIDAAAATRFTATLKGLLESGCGLSLVNAKADAHGMERVR